MKCLICGISLKFLNKHLSKDHNLSTKEYYDLYLKSKDEGYCLNCGKETPFIKLSKGYLMYCNIKCQATSQNRKNKIEQTNLIRYGVKNTFQTDHAKQRIKESRDKAKQTQKENLLNTYGVENIWQLPDIKQKIKNKRIMKNNIFEEQNNVIAMKKLVNLYGEGWKQNKQLNIPRIYYNNTAFIDIKYIDKIKDYYNSHNKNCASIYELEIINFLNTIYNGKIIKRSRKIIYPQELDIYLPDLKLAIEYNGTYWHSIEAGTPKDYHLNKSIKCRQLGIRLIHIYQFEDFDTQLQLLKDLILGQDNYPKNDFNKNNFITIPQPEIIYNKPYTIYGAGKLIR